MDPILWKVISAGFLALTTVIGILWRLDMANRKRREDEWAARGKEWEARDKACQNRIGDLEKLVDSLRLTYERRLDQMEAAYNDLQEKRYKDLEVRHDATLDALHDVASAIRQSKVPPPPVST